MTDKKSWWSRASTEEKLAQIDGGIACGMTARQIAMCVGEHDRHAAGKIGDFARYHGRNMPTTNQSAGKAGGKIGGYISGVLSARRRGTPDFEISSAFSIFGSHREPSIFDEVRL